MRLSQVGDDRTLLVLEHTATVPPEMWDQYGPGAVGVGWDGGLLGLALHFESGSGVSIEDKDAWSQSAEAREFMTGSADAWRVAHEASGAPAAEAATATAAAAANTLTVSVPPGE